MASQRLREFRFRRAEQRAGKKSGLSPLTEKADHLEAIKKAVEDAAAVSGGLWLSYLFVLFYIAVAAGAVTHEDLLLVRAVKLPFLNIELPLLAFFAIAPFLFVITHANALLHFKMLGFKALRYDEALRQRSPTDKETRDKLRRLLPSNILVHIFAGPPETRRGVFGVILILAAATSLVVLPIALLLLLQFQFLPYHDVSITQAQRVALALDVVLVWLLRPPTLSGGVGGWSFHGGDGSKRNSATAMQEVGLAGAAFLTLAALWLSFAVATVPGELSQKVSAILDPPSWRVTYVDEEYGVREEKTKPVSAHDLLLAGQVDKTSRRRKSLFSDTLVLPAFNIYEGLKIDDPKKLEWTEHTFSLRGRRLEGAVFDGANLARVDLTGARLQGASLQRAELQGASFYEAQLQGADLSSGKLQGASFKSAELQGADLSDAALQGAWLGFANLKAVSFVNAKLQGATLPWESLKGASLRGAELQGATAAGYTTGSFDNSEPERIKAIDFSGASLWRSSRDSYWKFGTVKIQRDQPVNWKLVFERFPPKLWSPEAYADLRRKLEENISHAKTRASVLRSIERLDCKKTSEWSLPLASCDPNSPPPPEVKKWQDELEKARVEDDAYEKALAAVLRELVCTSDANAIYVLRGVARERYGSRLAATGREAPVLIDGIIKGETDGKNCPVSAALTEDDKARLLQIKEEAKKKAAEAEKEAKEGAAKKPAEASPPPSSTRARKK